jgi:predicted RNase H-like HicB family nuclease
VRLNEAADVLKIRVLGAQAHLPDAHDLTALFQKLFQRANPSSPGPLPAKVIDTNSRGRRAWQSAVLFHIPSLYFQRTQYNWPSSGIQTHFCGRTSHSVYLYCTSVSELNRSALCAVLIECGKIKNINTYTAVVEKCPQTGFFVGYVPGFVGAHSQAETLDELNHNMQEVIEMLFEDGEPQLEAEFVGTQMVAVA